MCGFAGVAMLGASQHLATALQGAFLLPVMVVRPVRTSRFPQMMFPRR